MATVLITGGHSGIGLECSRHLAAKGHNLVLAGRSPERMQHIADELTQAHNVQVSLLQLDISSLASVRAAAAACQAMADRGVFEQLDALLCNAGGRFDGDEQYTDDGYELTFATNCLGHYLLVQLLLPMVPPQGRIVFTTSGTHDPDTMDGKLVGAAVKPHAAALANDGKDGAKKLSAGKRYSTSKLVDLMYAYELARRLGAAGSSITSVAFDPGSIADTGFLRGMPPMVQWVSKTRLVKWSMKRMGVVSSTAQFSGAALADIAVDGGFDTGSYVQANEGTLGEAKSSKVSYDKQLAASLWEDSRQLVQLLPHEQAA